MGGEGEVGGAAGRRGLMTCCIVGVAIIPVWIRTIPACRYAVGFDAWKIQF